MSEPFSADGGGQMPPPRVDQVIAALEAAVDALVPAVAWLRRQVNRLALVALVAGGLEALMLGSVARGAAAVVGLVAAGCAVVFGWYGWRLRQFVAGAPALRADLRRITDLPAGGRLALEAAAGDLRHGSFLRRLRATEAVSDTIRAHPLAERAGVVRRQLLPTNIGLVGWAVGITILVLLSFPVVALIALFAR